MTSEAVPWNLGRLSDIIDINPKRDITRGTASPFVAMADVTENQRSPTVTEIRRFKGSGARFGPSDVLLARITPCLENGKAARVDFLADGETAHGSTEFIVLSGKPGTGDTLFAYYLVRDPRFRAYAISHMSGTSGRQRVSPDSVANFEMLLPPLEDQRRIAWVLGSLDDKIESNRRVAATLERITASLFKARFVDFVDRDDLVESESGPIPRGWNVQPLGDVAVVLRRGRAPAYVDERGILVVNQKCVREGRVSFQLARRHDEQRRSSEDRRLQVGDALINSTGVGTLGRASQVRWLPEAATVDSHVTMVRADTVKVDQDYLAMSVMQREPDLERMGHGSTGQTELTRSRLAELPILLPPPEEQKSFSRLYSPIRDLIGVLEREETSLSSIRDALLPKLISGGLRVSQADLAEDPT